MPNDQKYAQVLSELIAKLQNIKNYRNLEETQDTLKDVCELLRIGKVEMKYFQTRAAEMKGETMSMVVYDCGHADDTPERINKVRVIIENGADQQSARHHRERSGHALFIQPDQWGGRLAGR